MVILNLCVSVVVCSVGLEYVVHSPAVSYAAWLSLFWCFRLAAVLLFPDTVIIYFLFPLTSFDSVVEWFAVELKLQLAQKFTFVCAAVECGSWDMYRGADNSLARPGRKEARKHVCDARYFSNIETRAVIKFFFFQQGKAPKEIHTILTETLACLFPFWSG